MSSMNKAKEEAGKIGHTPGPWCAVANESYWEVRTADDFGSVADTCASSASAPNYGRSWALGEANARLIAASPDLYAEMKRFLPVLEAAEADPETWIRLTAGLGIATANGFRAAISKAEGKV